ncbi:MAG TPA: dephospho-CoA kinase [Solirubrobacteraceae bacterium]
MPFVGLTGGIGAGKSTALAALERLGAAVISSDAVVHELYSGEQLRAAAVGRWGPEVAPGGVIDRTAVAERAFASPADRTWLEGMVWPLVGARVAVWLEEVRAQVPPPRAAVVEVPLLFEAGLEGIYDATIAVVADEPTRQRRAAGRGHALLEERGTRQLSQQEKARRATFVVRNDGTEEDLLRELSAVLAKLGR